MVVRDKRSSLLDPFTSCTKMKCCEYGIDLKRITRCKLALIFTSADHRKFLVLFGSEAARL
jgi:hypothetical protein